MASTTLQIPTLVQPIKLNGEDVFQIRPAFLTHPTVSHRLHAEAVKLYKGVVKRRFSGYKFNRENADQLLWFKFGPKTQLISHHLEFSLGSHFVKGLFNSVSFEWKGLHFACLPSFGDYLFMVALDENGRPQLRESVEKTVKSLLLGLKKSDGKDFELDSYFSPKKEFLTNVQMEVSFKEASFSVEDAEFHQLMASFRREDSFDGADELEKVGVDLCEKYPFDLRRAYYQSELATRLLDQLFRKNNSPVVLVGPEGVGKHTLVEEVVWRYMQQLAEKADDGNRHSFWHINPNRIIAGMSVVGQWEKRFEAILKYIQKPTGRKKFPDKILIDNPVALLRIGKAAQSDLCLANVLKPYLEKRQIQVVLLATPDEWKIMQDTERGFCDQFQMIRMTEPDMETSVRIVLQNRRQLELMHGCTISASAIGQLFTLHRNYLKNKALPGAVMKLLVQIASKYSKQAVDAPQVREEFKSFSGLQEQIFDEQEKLEKQRLDELLRSELVGQPKAVEALSNAIHLIKAKLTDRNRPFSSFLFIGPTGVGKTHAAKLLCKIMQGNDAHLLRFDMNEFIDDGAIHRLIGNFANPEGQLTGKVRYQPFSVVLLDEIEKAHPSILDLLLQMLDDARLTDSVGRTVDFSNTIIVMTSNLGAREAAAQIGFETASKNDSAVYRKVVENFFRPELVNRIEQIVIFNALEFSEIQKIAQLQIKELLQREGFVRRTTIVNVTEDALEWVAKRGYSARMGGRALKRQIERDLTLLSAEQLIKTTSDSPLILDILLENERLVPKITMLEFVKPLPQDWLPELPTEATAGQFLVKLLHRIEAIERAIAQQERRQEKASHLLDVGSQAADWKHYDFKNKVLEAKEATQLKLLRMREKRNLSYPAIPFRLKRVSSQDTFDAGRANKEAIRDRLFQERGLEELRDIFNHVSPAFDSFQTDYLISYLDLAILEKEFEGFLSGKTDQLTLKAAPCVNNLGTDETVFLIGLYQQLFDKLDIPYSLAPDKTAITAEEHSLRSILAGEEGLHMFYKNTDVPVPVRLTLLPGQEASGPLQVVRIYDGTSSLADIRSGYTNNAAMTPDELKLLLFAAFGTGEF